MSVWKLRAREGRGPWSVVWNRVEWNRNAAHLAIVSLREFKLVEILGGVYERNMSVAPQC